MKTKLAALAGLLSGVLILAIGGGEAPAWLRCMLVLFFGALSLVYGFTAFAPGFPKIFTSRPVIGVIAIWTGAAVMWIPPNVVLSSMLIGFGTRCLMLEPSEPRDESGAGTALARYRQRGGGLGHREPPQSPAHREED